jgi:hypothetical protein
MTKPEGLSEVRACIVRRDCYSRGVHFLTRSSAQRAFHEAELWELLRRISSFFRHSSLELRHFCHLYSRQFA